MAGLSGTGPMTDPCIPVNEFPNTGLHWMVDGNHSYAFIQLPSTGRRKVKAKASHYAERDRDREAHEYEDSYDWRDSRNQMRRGLTVQDGVKIGVGMFIVLPLILVGLVLLLLVCAIAVG